MKLDAVDLKILTALQRGGRITKLRLADVVEVLECYAIGGGVDYILKVIVTKPVKRQLEHPIHSLVAEK